VITEAVMNFLRGLAESVFTWAKNALPTPPGWVQDMTDAVTTMLGVIPDPVRYFVPVGAVIAAGMSFAGVILAIGLVRLARRVLSLFTGGGGNA
jgi:hypothetical protein